ncbi:EAL domain-containing protein [Aeromicrobium marinum]|uniref:EAL domain-containing protein n=1 Tax=Aeromicrobium marinum TaxID=219314 RepID=UPI00058DCD99|nr:EAL domain-containing protein [Aeromicrobium marinum]
MGSQPILDVVRGVAAGYQAVALTPDGQAQPRPRGGEARVAQTEHLVRSALTTVPALPTNTFISIPVPLDLLAQGRVRSPLDAHGELSGIVLDVVDFVPDPAPADLDALAAYRHAGATIAVGGSETAQPELRSILDLRPDIIRLGRDWIHEIDTSDPKRAAVELVGNLAAQLDAWILTESVSTAGELRALAGLGVPLAQGPLIGRPSPGWPDITHAAHRALPRPVGPGDRGLRSLLQQAYTTDRPPAADAPDGETSGFEVVVVVDEARRPVQLLVRNDTGGWLPLDPLTVNVDTPVGEAATRAVARPRAARFSPVVCTDAAGRFLGILSIERLMARLADGSS